MCTKYKLSLLYLMWYLCCICSVRSKTRFSSGTMGLIRTNDGGGYVQFGHLESNGPAKRSQADNGKLGDLIAVDGPKMIQGLMEEDGIEHELGPVNNEIAATVDLQQWLIENGGHARNQYRLGWQPFHDRLWKLLLSLNNSTSAVDRKRLLRHYSRSHISLTTTRQPLKSGPQRKRSCDKRCLNGGSCRMAGNNNGNDMCFCLIGFHGEFCQFVNDCDLHRGCGSHATCVNEAGAFRCNCTEGYVMSKNGCVAANENCEAKPCQNGGVCLSANISDLGGFTCLCKFGFGGRLCEVVSHRIPGAGLHWSSMVWLLVPMAGILAAQIIGLLIVFCNGARKYLFHAGTRRCKSPNRNSQTQLPIAGSRFLLETWLRRCCGLPSTTSGGGGGGDDGGEQFFILHTLLQDSSDDDVDAETGLQNEQFQKVTPKPEVTAKTSVALNV